VVIGLGARSLTDQFKGIKEFFEYLPLDAPWIKNVKFVLFGEGTLNLPPNLDVEMLGPLMTSDAMVDAYCAMDIYVSPTSMETFGMTLVEAQACGTPVVAFSTGATPEAICPEGGWLLRKDDFSALYELLETLCKRRDDLIVRGLNSAQWVFKHHSSDVIAIEQAQIYS
jgi:glycosyltransferase involved in cell wall biosynthesis